MAEARALVLNDALCFLLCKYGSVPVKLLKSALLDFYNEDVISEAKVCLLDNIANLQLAAKLPHVPQRRDGDGRITREVDDILLLISHLDEQKVLGSLPRFACSGPDNMPSLRIYEADFKVMMNMISKLSDKVAEMGSTLAAMVRDVRELKVKVSAPEPFPTLQQAQAQGVIKSASGWFCQQPQRSQCTGGKPVENESSELNLDSVVIQTSSNDSASRLNWANAVSTPHASSNRFAVLASTTDDDSNDNPFELVRQRKSKRQRHGTPEQQQQQQQQQQQRQPQQQRQQSAVGNRVSAPAAQSRDNGDRRRRRGGPLVFGRSSTMSVISAARELKQKAVYYIGNVNADCSADDLKAFVTDMRVEVFSCFPVEPRKRRDDENIPQSAFRLCINDKDRDRMLRPGLWPASVTVSKWHYKPPDARDQRPSEGDRGSLPVDQLQQRAVAQAASSDVTAAGNESADVTAEATGDDTVILMEYSTVNDDIAAPSNHDDGGK